MASRSASPNPSRPSIHSSRTPEAAGRNSTSDPNLSDSPEDFRHRRGRDAVRSTPARPSSPSSKGAKRFMSPTISAASKAVGFAGAPSPRRKILGERNEDSVLLPPFDSPATEAVGLKKPAATASKDSSRRELSPGPHLGFGSQDAPCCCCCGSGGECGEPMEEEDSDIKNHQSGALQTFRISPADRHLAPYDPDTNYLSPRPRFLHYRPNPRIKHYFHGQRKFLEMEDCKHLNDCFSDESNEDSSAGVGESQSSDLEEESEEEESSIGLGSQSPSSGEKGPRLEASGKGQASLGLKFAPFLLILIVACLVPFFWSAPMISSASSLLNAQVLHAADGLLKDLAYKVKQFPSNTFGRLSTFAATGGSFEQRAFDGHNYSGTTQSNDQRRLSTTDIETTEERCEGGDQMKGMMEPAEVSRDVLEDVGDMEAETTKGTEREVKVEVENDTLYEIEKMGGEADQNDSSPGLPETQSFKKEAKFEERDDGNTQSSETEFENEIVEFGKELDLGSGEVSTDNEVVVTGQEYGTGSLSDSGEVYSESISKAFDSQQFSVHALVANPWAKFILGLSSALLLLAAGAAAALIFLSRKKRQQSQEVNPLEETPSGDLIPKSAAQLKESYEVNASDSSTNLMESSSVGPRRTAKGGEEEQQDDNMNIVRRIRTRRESEGLSSSTSYGSFTAYAKVSAKKGASAKYDEAMTPVRRSSRIKNQITTSQ